MTDLQQYQKLSDVEHVLKRSSMYLGSTSPETVSCFVLSNDQQRFVEESITYSPALLKMFDEIISNSVDEHLKTGNVKTIRVTVDPLTGQIVVNDDGGIAVKIHPEYKVYIPEMIFGELRSGSNFEDDSRLGAGMNGLGSKLTSIFSDVFDVHTCDGEKSFSQTFTKNLSKKSKPNISKSGNKGTTIRFIPDYARLGVDELTEGDYKKILKRVYDVAGCNPKLKVYFDGKLIRIKSFKDYVAMYAADGVVDYSNGDWDVCITPNNDDSFKHVSFVNGVDTFNGGTHIDYVMNQIVHQLREFLKKKHKVDIKPNNIRQQMHVYINGNVNAPIFTSQTKEFMSLDPKKYETECVLPQAFINKILNSDILQNIIDWIESEKRRQDLAELRKLNKEAQKSNYLRKILKFDDATSKNRSECTLCLTEGDSASKTILSTRNPKVMGVFPLKGKPLNVRDIEIKKLSKNEEFSNIMAIMGLKLGFEDTTIDQLRFSKILVAADFDPDGQHIFGLIINMLQQFWPQLLKQGILYRLKTPMIIATKGKKEFEFFDRISYDVWAESNSKHTMKYYKGLGTFSSKNFRKYMQESQYHVPVTFDDEGDFDAIDLAFDKGRADDRKVWLAE